MMPSAHPDLLAPEPGPATLKTRPWGGSRLATLRDAPAGIARPIGESWEFSTLPDSESRCDGRLLGERLGRPLPFLAKLLDTSRALSIQVHPDDDPRAGRIGKEEAWVVLDADPGATVWAGIRPGIGEAAFDAAVRQAVADPRHGTALTAMLQAIEVRTGSVVLVPAGTVHAIGGGILLAELQQPTDCTFRLFDYGSERALQVDDGLAATRTEACPKVWQPGDAPAGLHGRHLALEILAPGRIDRHAERDELIVAHGQDSIAIIDGNEHPLPAGELRLATAGLRYGVEVGPGAGVVIGSIRSQGSSTGT